MRIELVYSPAPGQVLEMSLDLPEGATVADGLKASGLLGLRPELQAEGLMLGVWGKACPAHTPLRDRDRIEVYRPLTVDPKEARRLRYRGNAKR